VTGTRYCVYLACRVSNFPRSSRNLGLSTHRPFDVILLCKKLQAPLHKGLFFCLSKVPRQSQKVPRNLPNLTLCLKVAVEIKKFQLVITIPSVVITIDYDKTHTKKRRFVLDLDIVNKSC